MDAIRRSHSSRVEHGVPSRSFLDDRTWDDLNLDEVFAELDRTQSTLGQHALYHRLRTAPLADNLDTFEVLTTRMSTDASSRERAQMALLRLQDVNGYDLWWLSKPDALETPFWYVVFPLLTASTIVLVLLFAFQVGSFGPVVLAAIAFNLIVRLATDGRIRSVIAAFRQLAPLIATAQSLAFLDGEDIEPIAGAIRADVPPLGRLKMIARWASSNPLILPIDASYRSLIINDVAHVVYEYLNLAFVLDASAVYFGAPWLRANARGLLRVITAMGDIDAAIGVASFRAGTNGWTRPRFCQPDVPASLTGIRHPLVVDAVPSSIQMPSSHGVLVTGSNMSGKSTFLRTVGLSAVLAQTINTCLAADYEAPILNVRSCIGRSDDLLSGKSYYLAEVEALLSLVQASEIRTPHLFLLDELFRGTNAVERVAAGEAVLRELVAGGIEFKPHIVIAATHDGELVEMLSEAYSAYHFGDAIGPQGLMFDHRLLPGPATTRNAITLLQLQGAPESLVNRALKRAAALDRERAGISRSE